VSDAFEAVLAEYDARAARDEERMKGMPMDQRMGLRDELLLHVGLDSARILHSLVSGLKPKNIVELGTSYGYSTLWLADAARRAGGRVITLELAASKQAYARDMLGRAGLDSYVDFRCGDALLLLGTLEGPVDFAFVDLLMPKLSTGAVVVADNMLYPQMWLAEANAYRAHVRAVPGIDSILLPVGSGLEISRITRRT
jgi:predicted O-methyltransferase YrrM